MARIINQNNEVIARKNSNEKKATVSKTSLNVGVALSLDAIADIIIVDTGAGISSAVTEFLVASGEIILVTTPEPTSITDSYSLLKALNQYPRFSKDPIRYVTINYKSEITKNTTDINQLKDFRKEFAAAVKNDKGRVRPTKIA